MEIKDTRFVLLEEEKPFILLLTERQAKQEQRKYKELHPNLEYTIFYDEYYEYTEFINEN
jgi:hypothetical protein